MYSSIDAITRLSINFENDCINEATAISVLIYNATAKSIVN